MGFLGLPALKLPGLNKIKHIFPHVDQIEDAPTKQSLKLAWERIHDLEGRLQRNEAADLLLIDRFTTDEGHIERAQQTAEHALLVAQSAAEAAAGGAGGLPDGGDGGGAAEGFAAAGATGHDTGGLLTPVRAGQIVGGTVHEFSGLLAPVATQAQRDANLAEMLSRMIWHLRTAGFTAGKQQNPSGAISGDKLTVEVDGVMRVYDVLSDRPLTDSADAHMNEVPLPKFVDDAGTPD